MNSTLKGNGGVYETSPEKARASFVVFCPNELCGEMSVMAPLYSCDGCGSEPHHDFACPVCGTRWLEWAHDLKPLDIAGKSA